MATQTGAQSGSQELSPAVYADPPTRESSNTMALTAYNPPPNVSVAAQRPQAGGQESSVEAEAWPLVTTALMSAVITSQQPATAAMTFLTIFRPMVDGWAAARNEAKRWKQHAEAHMAEHHRQKSELGKNHESLLSQVEELERKLAETQGLLSNKTQEAQDLRRLLEAKESESETQRKAFHSTVTELQRKFAKTDADAEAAKEAYKNDAHESKRAAESLAKRAEEAKLMHEKFRQEAEKKEQAQAEEITKILKKIKESETIKSNLEEQLGATMAKNTSLEEHLAQKSQDYSSLESRITELTNRKEALERQLALYQRIPSRRW